MLDLSADGLDGVDSVGGSFGVDGSMMACEKPSECAKLLSSIQEPPPNTSGKGKKPRLHNLTR